MGDFPVEEGADLLTCLVKTQHELPAAERDVTGREPDRSVQDSVPVIEDLVDDMVAQCQKLRQGLVLLQGGQPLRTDNPDPLAVLRPQPQ